MDALKARREGAVLHAFAKARNTLRKKNKRIFPRFWAENAVFAPARCAPRAWIAQHPQ
jgi:hypothetical protein